MESPLARIPSRALYRGKPVGVLHYAGVDRFAVLVSGRQTEVHRRHLTFLPSRTKARQPFLQKEAKEV